MSTKTQPAKRRRRSPEDATREILVAAEALLAERPFRELSVDELMASTTLSRSSFYVYFRDRYDLLLRLVGAIEDELREMNDRWLAGGGDPRAALSDALEGVVAIYTAHGPVMRAIADAAGADPMVESVYRGLIDRFAELNAAHIASEQQHDQVDRALDALETSRALVWMTERYLLHSTGSASGAQIAQTLNAVWSRTLYGS